MTGEGGEGSVLLIESTAKDTESDKASGEKEGQPQRLGSYGKPDPTCAGE